MSAAVIIWWYGYPNLETLHEEVEANQWSQAFFMAYGEHGIRYIGSTENAREHPLPAELEREGNQTFYLGDMVAPEIGGKAKAWQNLATQSLAYATQALIRFLNPELNESCENPDDYVSVLSFFFDACDANGIPLDEDDIFAANPPEGFPTLVAHHPYPHARENEVVRPFNNDGWISVI